MTDTQHTDPTAPRNAAVGEWQLDNAATTIELHTKAMWGMAKVKGSFTALSGTGTVGTDGSVSGNLVIDAASVDTKQKKRDAHLRSADFFDVASYPTFEYTAISAEVGASGDVVVTGTFSAHGQTHPLEVRGQLTGVGSNRLTVTGEADLDRSNWGLDWTKMGARLDNHIVVTAVFTR